MENIIPRWEWRTFTNDLGKAEEDIKKHPEGKRVRVMRFIFYQKLVWIIQRFEMI